MSSAWAWAALAGLGAFHGLNPAMGWLFAVARGLQRGSRAAVLGSMLPIAAGHALSIAMVVAVIGVLSAFADSRTLHWGAGALLIGFGLYRLAARHRGRAGMQVGPGQLMAWSFIMATAHGAGLMLVPVLLAMPAATAADPVDMTSATGMQHMAGMTSTTAMAHGANMAHGGAHVLAMAAVGTTTRAALAAVALHTIAMLAVASAIALAVYEWLGLSFLRRGWINLDLLWVGVLVGSGAIVLATA